MDASPRVEVRTRLEGRRFRKGKAEGGQSLVEVALIMAVLILMLSGLVDLGRWIFMGMEVSSAARAGAQYGASNRATAADTAGITTAAKADAPGISGLNVSVPTPSGSNGLCRCSAAPSTAVACSPSSCSTSVLLVYVEVDTTATYTPWVTYAIIGSRTLHGKAVMPVGQ